ncbi:MAG: glycosyltransferase [Candidatus Orphnella occulta]|nr:glycosyltransferase [Candidatus Orphnella occulta]
MKFLFITRESRVNPGARIRCFGFSARLNAKGFNSSVFSFVDKLNAKSGKEDINFSFIDKVKCAFNGYKALYRKTGKSIFVVNRFNYHAIPAWLVAELRGIPFVFDMDDWEARESRGSRAEYLTRFFAKRSVFCIAASKYLSDYLSQFNSKVFYLPTAVDTDKFKPSLCKEKKDFVFSWHGSVNRIELIGYIKFAIECFQALYNKYPFIKFFIAADGIFIEELKKLIRDYNCENIIYKGWLDYVDIPAYLDDIDCGLIPLLDRTRFNLSKSPVKLFEYMAKAKPVVASRIGEANYIIKDGHNGFLSSSKREFVENMEKLINDPKLAEDVGVAARKEIEKNYSLDILGERFVRILKDDFNNYPNS